MQRPVRVHLIFFVLVLLVFFFLIVRIEARQVLPTRSPRSALSNASLRSAWNLQREQCSKPRTCRKSLHSRASLPGSASKALPGKECLEKGLVILLVEAELDLEPVEDTTCTRALKRALEQVCGGFCRFNDKHRGNRTARLALCGVCAPCFQTMKGRFCAQ